MCGANPHPQNKKMGSPFINKRLPRFIGGNIIYIDLTGQRFGRLVVIKRAGTAKDGRALWLCCCDCGNEITTSSANLVRGHSKSCGCFRIERIIESHKAHGDGKHRERNRLYHIWGDMKHRCSNPNCRAYKNYGGRGITVCEEWQQYQPFRDWALHNGYSDELTLDRMDTNGNYEPDNCRWITKQEQCFNKRTSHLVTYQGVTQTVSQWAKEYNIPRTTLAHRLDDGWSVEDALTLPSQKGKRIDEPLSKAV